MIDIEYEISQLRWQLQNSGYSYHHQDEICAAARREVDESIIRIVSAASADAVSYAEDIGAVDFFTDIEVVNVGHTFEIRTRSGITDYSTDRVENLNNILKSGKVAKDGSRYQHVPIKEKTKMGKSSFDNAIAHNATVSATREAMSQKRDLSQRASAIADQMRQSMSQMMAAQRNDTPKFRTASSKQDATSQWVIPETNRDMTQFLYNLNDQIEDATREAVSVVVSNYMQEYI